MPSSTDCSSIPRRPRPPRPRRSSSRTRRRRGAGSIPTALRAMTSSADRPACRPATPSPPAASPPTPTRPPRPTPAPAGPRLVQPRRRRLVLHHQLHRRRRPRRRPVARPGALLPRLGQQGPQRAGADQQLHRHGAGHREGLVVLQRRLPGLEGIGEPGDHHHQRGPGQCRPRRTVPRRHESEPGRVRERPRNWRLERDGHLDDRHDFDRLTIDRCRGQHHRRSPVKPVDGRGSYRLGVERRSCDRIRGRIR